MGIITELGIENISGKYETLEMLFALRKKLISRQNSPDAKKRSAAEMQLIAVTELSNILEKIEDEVKDVSLVVRTYAYAYDNDDLNDEFKKTLEVAMSTGDAAFDIARYLGNKKQDELSDCWVLVSAELGCEDTYQICGYILIESNPDKAIEWFAKAEMAGKINASNIYNWGYIYYSRNLFDAAKQKFETASVQGQGLASYYLARMYEYGQGVPANVNQAINLYKVAYQRGVQQAQNDIARLSHGNQTQSRNVTYDRPNTAETAKMQQQKNEYAYVKKDNEKPWLVIFLAIIGVLIVLNLFKVGMPSLSNYLSTSAVPDKGEQIEEVDPTKPYLWTIEMNESEDVDIVNGSQNSLGNTFEQAVVLSGYGAPYVKYYLGGQYERLVMNVSCLETDGIKGEEFDFRVIIDDETDEPAYRTKIKRAMTVTTVDVDVTGADFITIVTGYGDTSYEMKGVILSDAVLYQNYEGGEEAIAYKHSMEFPEEQNLLLAKMVESEHVMVESGLQNSLGITFEQALVLSGYGAPYVKYYLGGQYERLVMNVSCLETDGIKGEEFDFRVIIDDETDEPAYRTKIKRAMAVTTVDVDVTGADFITIVTGYGDTSYELKGVILSDIMLYQNQEDVMIESIQSDFAKTQKLTSLKMVDAEDAYIEEDVTNSLGDIFARGIVLSGYNEPYVKYYLGGRYERLILNVSCLEDNSIEGESFDFRIFVDDQNNEPISIVEMSRDMEVCTIDVDVTNAEFIVVQVGYGNTSYLYKGAVISKGVLYSDYDEGDLNEFNIEREFEDSKLTKFKIVEANAIEINEDVKNTKGNLFDRAIVLSGYNMPYVTYYLAGEYKRFVVDISCLDSSSVGDDSIVLSVYGDGNISNPIRQVDINRNMESTNVEIDVTGLKFITIEAGTGNLSYLYKGVILANGMLYK